MSFNQRLYLLAIVLLAVFLEPVAVSGQGMCVPKPVKVSRIRGQVFFGYNEKQRPQQDVIVEITHYRNQKRIIASTVSDADGFFHIDGIRPGKYWLRTIHHQIIGIDVELNIITTSSQNKTDVRRIVFVLGADPSKLCGGGHVEVIKQSDARK